MKNTNKNKDTNHLNQQAKAEGVKLSRIHIYQPLHSGKIWHKVYI